jgi:hypothetical protein
MVIIRWHCDVTIVKETENCCICREIGRAARSLSVTSESLKVGTELGEKSKQTECTNILKNEIGDTGHHFC